EVVVQQIIPGSISIRLHVQDGPVPEGALFALQVHPRHKPAQLPEHCRLIQFRGPAAAPWRNCNTKRAAVVERLAVDRQRCDYRYLLGGEFGGEPVLLEDRIVAPASRTIELRHHRRLVLDSYAIHAVLVAVQREEAPVAVEAQVFQGGQDIVRAKIRIRQYRIRWSCGFRHACSRDSLFRSVSLRNFFLIRIFKGVTSSSSSSSMNSSACSREKRIGGVSTIFSSLPAARMLVSCLPFEGLTDRSFCRLWIPTIMPS